ncbi:UNVERIFIED_CONTAM: putative pentatricopeptide repeat-containing protein [Sesamum angustifolium]|uniref:Pentatricopeptide repeat-containing protein n=1 Tax=Sesamum angustifolium TaxID=2727405 RepID=A0AAW2NZY5_9LAMI
MSPRFPSFSSQHHARKSSNYFLSRALTTLNFKINCSEHCSNIVPVNLDPNAALQDPEEALRNPYLLNKIISSCAEKGCFSMGILLHCHVIKMGFHSNVHINTSLIDMYGKCAEVLWAHRLFDEMPNRNAVTWNALVSGYVTTREPRTAIQLFLRMLREGVPLTAFGVSAALVACAQLEDAALGAQVQGLSLKAGWWSLMLWWEAV